MLIGAEKEERCPLTRGRVGEGPLDRECHLQSQNRPGWGKF
jgi:hypothetical protein